MFVTNRSMVVKSTKEVATSGEELYFGLFDLGSVDLLVHSWIYLQHLQSVRQFADFSRGRDVNELLLQLLTSQPDAS